MAITSKDLGNISRLAGTLKVTLFYDDSTVSSSTHIPTAENSIVKIGEVIERYERTAGVNSVGSMSITLRDEYSNYNAGVWRKILGGSETQFRFYLDEGTGDTFLFWGIVKSKLQYKEVYVNDPGASGIYIRGIQITLLSLLKKVENLSFGTYETAVLAGYTHTEIATVSRFMKLHRLFTHALVSVFGSNAHLDNSISLNKDDEIQYFEDHTDTWKVMTDTFIEIKHLDTDPNPYLYGDSEVRWSKRFPNVLNCLGSLAKSFGYVMRYFYGNADGTINATPSNNLHRIALLSRGRNTGSYLTFGGREKESGFENDIDYKIESLKVIRSADEADYFGSPENVENPDLKMLMEFHADGSSPATLNWYEILYHLYNIDGTFNANIIKFSNVKYYDYVAGTFSTAPLFPDQFVSIREINGYYKKRFSGKTIYKRKYRGIQATEGSTTSHTVIFPTKRTQIHDGIGNKAFYASEVRKNVEMNEMSIEWIEE